MKRPSLVTGFLMAATMLHGVHAADMDQDYRTVSVPAQVRSWTGFYAGINAGYGFGGGQSNGSQTNYANTSGDTGTETHGPGGPAWRQPAKMTGFEGGGQVGYNYQIGHSWLVGLEADIQDGKVSGSSSMTNTTVMTLQPFPATGPNLWPVTGTATVQQQVDWYGTVRGRVGLLTLDNSLLLYGTGGLAYGSTSSTFSYSGGFLPDAALGFGGSHWSGTQSSSDIKTGWVAGGGLEYNPKGWDNWSVKAEYLLVDLGSSTIALTAPAFRNSNGTGGRSVSATNTGDLEFQTVKIGLNYRFN